jgi:hypothetical protein
MNLLTLAFVAVSLVDYGGLDINPDATHVTPDGVMVYGVTDGPCLSSVDAEDHFAVYGMSLLTRHSDGFTITYVFITPDGQHAEIWQRALPSDRGCLKSILLKGRTFSDLIARAREAGEL